MEPGHSSTGLTLAAIRLYPLKGARAVAVDRAAVTPRGLAGDREWMIVDAGGTFVSQRSTPRLARVAAESRPGGLALAAPGLPDLLVPVPDGSRRLAAGIWKDTVDAADAGDEAAAWVSDLVGAPCRLAYQDDPAARPLRGPRGRPGDTVSFADGAPVLLCGEAALAALNARLDRPVEMDRFRPNLVFAGGAPHAEDGWRRLGVGGVVLRNAGPCPRCTVTTVDQATGARGREPLATLSGYRRREGGVMFGVNLVPETGGTVRVGDPLEVLARLTTRGRDAGPAESSRSGDPR